MPRGGKNHAQGGGNRSGGENFRARLARAGQYISSPPLANFSCTPLVVRGGVKLRRWGGNMEKNKLIWLNPQQKSHEGGRL